MKAFLTGAFALVIALLPPAANAEWGYGLGREHKGIYVPEDQQSGWRLRREIAPAPVKAMPAPKKEAPKQAVAEPQKQVAQKPLDSDNDGVIDEKDECPGTPSGTKVDATGCSVNVKAVTDNWVLTGVQFETGSDKIKPTSYGVLDEAAGILKARSKVRVEIQGHTDNVGSAAANQTLSDRRAMSVKNYLTGMGVSAGQLETRGLGAVKPVADNGTAEGRAKNRRIEFKVLSR